MRPNRFSSALIAASIACALLGPLALPTAAPAEGAVIPDRRWVGFYVPGAPGTMAPLEAVESKVAVRAGISNYFQSFEQGFTATEARNAISHGTMPLITLEFTNGVQSSYNLSEIANGECDYYLRPYARAARSFGHEVWIRPLHEMNGNWYPWCGTVNGNSPAEFVRAWRHVRDVFREEGADNVKFVWCPNIESIPNTSGNAIGRYWPGEDAVDYMALDGYNFGEGDGIHWRSFESLYTPAYNTLTSLSDKPLLVAEVGCATVGGDKASWIAEMFRVIPERFPRIIGLGWFNHNCDRLWRIDTSAGSVQAFAAGAARAGWLNKTPTGVTIATSKKRLPRRKKFTLAGALSSGGGGQPVIVEVRRPGSKKWAYSATRRTGAGAAWSYSYKGKLKGTYYFRARFPGDFGRTPSLSRTVKVSVR